MYLLTEERDAISAIILPLGHDEFDTFLMKNGLVPISTFSSNTNPMPNITYGFITWLKANSDAIQPCINGLVHDYPAHPAISALQNAQQRLAHPLPRATAAYPWNDSLIQRVSVVNRASLRVKLSNICGGQQIGVTLIDGLPRTGRSHSWYLINHVASRTVGWRAILIDVAGFTSDLQNLPAIAQKLATRLHLGSLFTSDTGCTPETLAARYANEIADAWNAKQPRDNICLVFDSVDKDVVSPEIKSFIRALAEMRIRHELADWELFLLGANLDWGIVDTHNTIDIETLGPFLEHEIRHTATAINRQGISPLTDAELQTRIAEILKNIAASLPDEVCAMVGQLFGKLRREVNA